MKWLIASDIHGSALFTRQLLERFRAEGADRLLLLGDLLYHGPRNDLPEGYAPKEVIRLLNSVKDRIFCVRATAKPRWTRWSWNSPCWPNMPCWNGTGT